METFLAVIILVSVPVAIGLTVWRKIGSIRDSVEALKDTGVEMLETGQRMSGLIRKDDDPVEGIIDGRMATVGLAALVMRQQGRLSKSDWRALHAEVMTRFQTGEAQAGDLIMLSQWLVGKLDADDIPRLARRAAELAGRAGADDLLAIVSRWGEAIERSGGPGLPVALSALDASAPPS